MNSLFDVTKPTHMSMFPLDLRHSVDIISTILTLLSKNLQQGGGTGVVNTAVSFLRVPFISFRYSALLDNFGCDKQPFE